MRRASGAPVQSERDGVLDRRVSDVARAAAEAADTVGSDGSDLEEIADLVRCDWCGESYPSYEVLPVGDVLACEGCRDDHDDTPYDYGLEYKTRIYRGVEDW